MPQPIIRSLQNSTAFYLQHCPVNYKKAGVFVKILSPLLLDHPFRGTTTTSFGFRMFVDTTDAVARYIYAFGVWEPGLSRFVARRLKPGDVFIDLGANIGYYTLLAAKLVGQAGRVVSVEASPSIYAELVRNLQLNRVDNVSALQCAVSDSSGTLEVFAGLATNRGETTVIAQRGFPREAIVRKAPFDALIEPAEFRRARVIKIDVEGHEPEALTGLFRLLESARDDLEIVVELTGQAELAERGIRQSEILETFASYGFGAYQVDNRYSSWTYARAEHSGTAHRVRASLDAISDVVFSKIDAETLTL